MIDSHIKESNDAIDDIINSRYPFSKPRRTLEIDKALLFMIGENFKMSFQIVLMLDALKVRIENVERIVKSLTEQPDVDLSSIKTEVALLKKQQLPKEARQYINEFREEWEEWKQESKKWLVGRR